MDIFLLTDIIAIIAFSLSGFLVGIDEWGVKKLAYAIKKRPRGFYARIDFCGHGDLVGEIERFFRIG